MTHPSPSDFSSMCDGRETIRPTSTPVLQDKSGWAGPRGPHPAAARTQHMHPSRFMHVAPPSSRTRGPWLATHHPTTLQRQTMQKAGQASRCAPGDETGKVKSKLASVADQVNHPGKPPTYLREGARNLVPTTTAPCGYRPTYPWWVCLIHSECQSVCANAHVTPGLLHLAA